MTNPNNIQVVLVKLTSSEANQLGRSRAVSAVSTSIAELDDELSVQEYGPDSARAAQSWDLLFIFTGAFKPPNDGWLLQRVSDVLGPAADCVKGWGFSPLLDSD